MNLFMGVSTFKRSYFWSYDWENGSLPLSIITKQVLIYGELEEIVSLFELFGINEVKAEYNLLRNELLLEHEKLVKLIDRLIEIRY